MVAARIILASGGGSDGQGGAWPTVCCEKARVRESPARLMVCGWSSASYPQRKWAAGRGPGRTRCRQHPVSDTPNNSIGPRDSYRPIRPVGEHVTRRALSTALTAVSSEEAHTTWTDQQSHDNEYNTPEDPAAKDRDTTGVDCVLAPRNERRKTRDSSTDLLRVSATMVSPSQFRFIAQR